MALKCGCVARFERGDAPAGGDEVANDLQRTQVSDLHIYTQGKGEKNIESIFFEVRGERLEVRGERLEVRGV